MLKILVGVVINTVLLTIIVFGGSIESTNTRKDRILDLFLSIVSDILDTTIRLNIIMISALLISSLLLTGSISGWFAFL